MIARRAAGAVLALLALDLVLLLVTGERSLLALGGSVGAVGLALRAAALGAAVVARFRWLETDGARAGWDRLVLVLLLLPTLVQFQLLGARLNGDGPSYYVFLRSMVEDRDFDLANEYGHYEMITRWDLAIPTRTGLRRSIYSVGPAVVWTPFFLLGDGVARVEGWLTRTVPDLSGYGTRHVNAVALGNLLYGFAGLLLIHALLRRHFDRGLALGAVLLLWGTTFFHWYLVVQPMYAHSPSMLLAAYALWLWDRDRVTGPDAWGRFYLGAILGLAMCVRWQNGVLLILPALDLVAEVRARRGRWGLTAASAALLAAGVALGSFPQMAAWKSLYDLWVLPCPPQGCDFIRLDHPWVLETLFSSRHGLLSWTPAFWAGYLGFIPLAWRRPRLAAILVPPLLLMSYVNMCVGDWWGGASFSNRRFDSVLPLLAFGFASTLGVLRDGLRRRPALAMPAAVLPFALWNAVSSAAIARGLAGPAPGVPLSRLAGGAARLVSQAVGFPTTWPASWIFAASHDLSPDRYDLVVGRYLFYRQNNFDGRLDLAAPAVEPFLDGAWRAPETVQGTAARCAFGRSRVLAPLDGPEDLELRFQVVSPAGPRETAVLVNGRSAGSLRAGPGWSQSSLGVAAGFWKREINEIVLDPVQPGGLLCVARVEFTPTSRKARRS